MAMQVSAIDIAVDAALQRLSPSALQRVDRAKVVLILNVELGCGSSAELKSTLAQAFDHVVNALQGAAPLSLAVMLRTVLAEEDDQPAASRISEASTASSFCTSGGGSRYSTRKCSTSSSTVVEPDPRDNPLIAAEAWIQLAFISALIFGFAVSTLAEVGLSEAPRCRANPGSPSCTFVSAFAVMIAAVSALTGYATIFMTLSFYYIKRLGSHGSVFRLKQFRDRTSNGRRYARHATWLGLVLYKASLALLAFNGLPLPAALSVAAILLFSSLVFLGVIRSLHLTSEADALNIPTALDATGPATKARHRKMSRPTVDLERSTAASVSPVSASLWDCYHGSERSEPSQTALWSAAGSRESDRGSRSGRAWACSFTGQTQSLDGKVEEPAVV